MKKRIMLVDPQIKNELLYVDFYDKHYALEEKAQLCIDVAKFEDKFVNKDPKNISIYIGMAFCPTRCLYCSFASNSIGGKNKKIARRS